MKKWILLVFILLLPGCHKQSTEIAMPDTLKLAAELPKDSPDQLGVYEVEWLEIQEELALETFMTQEEYKKTDTADGVHYGYEDDNGFEALLLEYSDTRNFTSYNIWNSDTMHITEFEGLLDKTLYPDEVHQLVGNAEMETFAREQDLRFMKQEDAVNKIQEYLDAIGLTNLQIQQIYTYDAETMNRNRDIYNHNAEMLGKEQSVDNGAWMPIEKDFTEEDERYQVHYQQCIEGIPITHKLWMQVIREIATESDIAAVYSKRFGMEYFCAQNLYTVGELIETVEIFSAKEAINVYLEEYNQAIHYEQSRIESIELEYIVVMDGDTFIAKPAWILVIDSESENAMEFYKTIAINAETGVILEGEKDLR